MAHLLTEDDVNALVSALSANYVMDACGGKVRLITAALPGKAVCATRHIDDVLHIVFDIEKPLAYRHVRQMIREMRANYVEPVVTNGAVQLVSLPMTPEPDGVCELTFAEF